MKDQKSPKIFIVLFILFAASGFIATTNVNLVFLPFLVWIIFAICLISYGFKKTKSIKDDPEIKNKIDNLKKTFEDTPSTNYDKCDNFECDTHKRSNHVKKCPLCNTVNDSNAHYCKICGEELDKDIF